MREDHGFVPANPATVGTTGRAGSSGTAGNRSGGWNAGFGGVPSQRTGGVSVLAPDTSRAHETDDETARETAQDDDRPLARVLPFRPAAVQSPVDVQVDERARAQGFAAGYAAGSRAAAKVAATEAEQVVARAEQDRARRALEHQQALEILARAATAAQTRTQPVLDQVERRLHLAAVELAQALLGVELSDAERSGRAALARVLGNPRLPEAVTVRLHPRDLEALRAADVEVTLADGVVLAGDPSLAYGDAVAEHPDGLLDARLGEALTRALDALLEQS